MLRITSKIFINNISKLAILEIKYFYFQNVDQELKFILSPKIVINRGRLQIILPILPTHYKNIIVRWSKTLKKNL